MNVIMLFCSFLVRIDKTFVQHEATDICLCCFRHVVSVLFEYFVEFRHGEGFDFAHKAPRYLVSICVLSSHQFRDGTNAELDLFYLLS